MAVAAAVAAEAVEDAGGKEMSTEKTTMKSNLNVVMSLIISAIAFAMVATSCPTLQAASEPKKNADAAFKQKSFNTPKEAADNLVQAAEAFDLAALKEILGPDSADIITSQDPVEDKNRATAFAAMAKAKSSIETDPHNPNRNILIVGDDNFPLPIPIVKSKGKWMFDTKLGREEILNRRIGTNELDAIAICRGFVEAQQEYAQEKHDDSKVNQYAQRVISTPGKHDGLAWQNSDGTWGGPVGEKIARAIDQGYSSGSEPYHGYFFKILKGQGPDAPLGEMDYVVKGLMIGGFALVAAPAEYGVTGVRTFLVSQDGVVYEKDLGPKTLDEFKRMERFNPDKSWTPVEEEDE